MNADKNTEALKTEQVSEPAASAGEKLPPLFDSHAHYTDERFNSEYPGGADALLSELFDSGTVGYIMNVATNPLNSVDVINQAKKYPNMYSAVGIHPSDIEISPLPLEAQLADIAGMIADKENNKIKAIGEIGLDYYWEPVKKEAQKAFFRAQLELAIKNDMPVIIHDREAHGDCLDIVREYAGVRGVFHCYSGSAETAKELLKLGWYISFTGTVTFSNAHKVREAAAVVPSDRLLLETDCPYLAPVPYRGKLNHSGLAVKTAEALAAVKDIDISELIIQTSENARRLFGI